MDIKVLGTGCPKCKTLEKMTYDVVQELNIEATISKIDSIVEIMKYGILSTPGLVINEKVILSGRIPEIQELKKLLENNI